MRVELTTVDACEGCGKCCEHIGLPPFEVPNPDLGPIPRAGARWYSPAAFAQEVLDTELFLAMPADLRAEHARLVTEVEADPSGTPCAWLDPVTKRCKHYEWRPSVCRDWVPGERGCNAARHRGMKVVWRDAEWMRPDDWWNPRGELPGEPLPRPRPILRPEVVEKAGPWWEAALVFAIVAVWAAFCLSAAALAARG